MFALLFSFSQVALNAMNDFVVQEVEVNLRIDKKAVLRGEKISKEANKACSKIQ